jgi:penicillin-binding protein 2
VEGFIPTRKWYLARYSNKFRIGFTLNNIIGQGDTKVTPLHLGLVYAAIINGGRLFFPQILERIETPSGRVIQNFPSRLKRHISVSSSNLAHIIEALIGVVHDPSGTAFESSLKNIKVGGKTGTAQTPNKYGKNSDRKMWFFNLDHAWFVAFAPAENPEIVVTVLIEHGGGASKTAVPVGMKIIQTYFERTKGIEIPTIATKEIKKKRFKQGPALISIRKY